MAELLSPKALPKSAGSLKSSASFAVRVAWGVALLFVGLGIFQAAKPWLGRVPVVGNLIAAGEGMVPGRAGGPSTDEFGTVF